jgi:hypothetical protein
VGDRMIRVVLVLHVYIQGYMYMGVLKNFTYYFHCVPYIGELLGCNETFL